LLLTFDCRLQDIYYDNFGDISLRDGPLSGSRSEDSDTQESDTIRNATFAAGTRAGRDFKLVEPVGNRLSSTSTSSAQKSMLLVSIPKPSDSPARGRAGRGRRAGQHNAGDGPRVVRGLVGSKAGEQHRRKAAGKGRPASTSSVARSRQTQASSQVVMAAFDSRYCHEDARFSVVFLLPSWWHIVFCSFCSRAGYFFCG
jgi:hypothetical protein